MKKRLRFSFLVTLRIPNVWEETKMKSVAQRHSWRKVSANNGVALCDITHGRFPIAVCFSTHFESYKLDFSPFWEAH